MSALLSITTAGKQFPRGFHVLGIILDACIVGQSKAEIQAAVLESERRLAEKHARLEGAVVQVLIPAIYD